MTGGKTEQKKIAGSHPNKMGFFFLLMKENFMSLSYSSLFFSSHVKEHGSMRASLTHSRTGQEGAGRQAWVFPKLHSPAVLAILLKIFLS